MTDAFQMALSMVSTIFAVVALVVALIAWMRVEAMQRATHAVQFVPMEVPKSQTQDEEADLALGAAEADAMDKMDLIHQRNEPLM